MGPAPEAGGDLEDPHRHDRHLAAAGPDGHRGPALRADPGRVGRDQQRAHVGAPRSSAADLLPRRVRGVGALDAPGSQRCAHLPLRLHGGKTALRHPRHHPASRADDARAAGGAESRQPSAARHAERTGGHVTTRRERLERKLEKRQEWAEGRQAKADAGFRVGDEHRDASGRMDWALVTQPGHIPERARIIRAHDKACEHLQVARHHESKAAGLAHQLETSIYSDDPDAIEALEARITELEAKRARMKASNAAFRKGDAAWAAHLGVTVEKAAALRAEIMAGYSWCQQPHPSYELTNLGGNIRRLKERIKVVQHRQT